VVVISERVVAGLVCLVAEPIGAPQPYPLIFTHGMWEGPLVWRKYLRFFQRRGYRCYAPYLRGYHDQNPSPHKDEGEVSVNEYLDDMRGVIREVALTCGASPICFGHSMGGLLTQKLASESELGLYRAVLIASAAPRGFFHVRNLDGIRLTIRHSHQFLFGSHPLPLSCHVLGHCHSATAIRGQ